ncbi:MAG: type I-F CRISPR-associated protein Csy2 [Deferribacterales bacterium]
MCKSPNALLIVSGLRIINANSISGPLTWGFPAPTAFTGFIHALSRRLGDKTVLDGTGIVCHSFEPQVNGGKYENRFNLTRNPVYDRDVTKPSGIVEEGRTHLTVTVLAGIYGEEPSAEEITQLIGSMRIAGGSIVHQQKQKVEIVTLSQYAEDDEKIFRKLRRKLVPGFALIDRTELMLERMSEMKSENPAVSLLDVLLDLTALKHASVLDENGKAVWTTYREKNGWIVPLPVGYAGISPLYEAGEVRNTRDQDTPFRFTETAYSAGEWRNPLKINNIEEFLWFHKAEPDKGVYLCGHKKLY